MKPVISYCEKPCPKCAEKSLVESAELEQDFCIRCEYQRDWRVYFDEDDLAIIEWSEYRNEKNVEY